MRAFGENPASFSEPDVILDFGSEGLVVVEAKLRSGNDWKPADYAGWTRGYLNGPAFRDAEAVLRSGRYELARNWRIAWELSGPGRPVCLVNLGRRELFEREDVGPFRACLSTSAQATFVQATWKELLGDEHAFPAWFASWRRDRGV
ncbi:MAG: hypothetical protein AB7I50_26820 [Vicinamibacterales bacterium]